MDIKSIELINKEIERLGQKQASGQMLDINDIRSLEVLVKTRQLLMGEPTDITKELSDDVTEADVMSILKPKLVK